MQRNLSITLTYQIVRSELSNVSFNELIVQIEDLLREIGERLKQTLLLNELCAIRGIFYLTIRL